MGGGGGGGGPNNTNTPVTFIYLFIYLNILFFVPEKKISHRFGTAWTRVNNE